MRKDFFEEFCREFAREMSRLLMEQRAGQAAAKRELARLEARRKKLVESIMEGVPGSEVKDELVAIANRPTELEQQLKSGHEPPPLLHPSMADLYRTKVEQLAAALQARWLPTSREVQILPYVAKATGFSPVAFLVAGAGFEPADPRFSNLLMAHDFWSQVPHQQRVIDVGFVLVRPLVFSRLLPSSGDIVETGRRRSESGPPRPRRP